MPLSSNRSFSEAPALNQERPEQDQLAGWDKSFGQAAVLRPSIWPAAPADAKKPRIGVIDGYIKTCERWGLNKSQQIALLGYSGNELVAEHVLAGRMRASQDVLDRTGYILGISIGLSALFNKSLESELGWLRSPNSNTGQLSPLEFMLKGRMVNLIAVFNLVASERAL
jgi:hypothetical protein